MKIWFDTITPKQYLFSEYFIQKLKHKHKIFVTSRKYPQVNDIMRFGVTTPILVGKHGGKNKIDKLLAGLERSKILTKKIEKFNPDLLISFQSPEASRVAYGLGIPHIGFSDSPHATAVMKLTIPYITKLLTPWIIPKKDFIKYGISSKDIIQYRAIDAGIIIKNYPKLKKQDSHSKKVILIRPEEIQASYVTQKSNNKKIIKEIIKIFPNEKKIILSRYDEQSKYLRKEFGSKVSLYTKPINGQKILKKCDCFIGSGGTMTAEAGLLGVPTISLNTVPNKIENYLVKNKVIQRSSKPEDVIKKISQILKNHKSVRERQKNAHQLLSSFDDPYKILLKAIQKIKF